MRFVALFCLSLLSIGALNAESIRAFGHTWTVHIASDWKLEGDALPTLHLTVPRPQTQPRRPKQFALAETPPWQNVTISLEAKAPEGHFIIVYAFRDESHFNYAHLSIDQATKQPVHNGMFHVYGGDRVRISSENGPAALSSKDDWYKVQLTHDAKTGIAGVTINGKAFTVFEAVDLSLGPGKVGLGSFFNTALFRNIKITGAPAM